MDIVRIENGKYEEYENLLLERDQVQKGAGRIWTAYQKKFGKLLTEVFEAKLECIKRKKIIAYFQKMINCGLPLNQDEMMKWIEDEMRVYKVELAKMLRDYKSAKDSGTSTVYEAARSKQLYRKIAKLIHPDIHPETDRNEVLIDLWSRADIAYGKNDVKELSEILVLVRKALSELGIDVNKINIPDIDEKISELRMEIKDIKSNKPYVYITLVENEKEGERELENLRKELEEYKAYTKELDDTIDGLIKDGGVSIKWLMN